MTGKKSPPHPISELQHSAADVARLIYALIDESGEDAWAINNGWCWWFALKLQDRLGPGSKVVHSDDFPDGTFPGHSWVEYKGLHFDAETPEGVSEPRLMQYHRRLRAIADSTDDISCEDAVRNALGHDPVYYGKSC